MLLPTIAPGIAVFCPVVGHLPLRPVFKRLLEQAETVAQAVAAQRDPAGDRAVQIAGRQTAQAAVAQRRVLDLLQTGQVDPLPGEGIFHFVQDAEIEKVVVYQPADQIFGRKIKSLPFAQPERTGFGPVVAHGQHHRAGQRVVQVLGGRLVQPFILIVFQKRLCVVEYILRRVYHTVVYPFLLRFP